MLVLSRKLGERILIGDNVVVTIVRLDRHQVRIGIEAPSEVEVYREEISPDRLPVIEETEPAPPVRRGRQRASGTE